MSKLGINIKIIFIVTSVNKFTVPPLRTLRIPERKTCLPIEKPGGCNTIKRRNTSWISSILRRPRICLLKHAIYGKIEDTKRRSRRREPLLDCLN